jgi:hypothetical protein
LLAGGDSPPDEAPFRDRAFHAAKLATAGHNVKVAWAKRQQRVALGLTIALAGIALDRQKA